jgi:hypothetical protein
MRRTSAGALLVSCKRANASPAMVFFICHALNSIEHGVHWL